MRVRARQVGAATWIEVADQGSGIAPANRERVFERFGTLGGRGDPDGGGTGLATQNESLKMLGCVGRGTVRKFAEIVAGVVLAVAASLVTTFAGLIADPVQLWTGVHRRRLMRMLARLDRQQAPAGIEREHVLARLGDLGDIASSIWRGLR